MTTERLLSKLSAISCTSLYDFGSYKMTFETEDSIFVKLTTFLLLCLFVSAKLVSFTSISSTYSNSSSVLKKFLNFSLKLIIFTSTFHTYLFTRLIWTRYGYGSLLLQQLFHNRYSFPSI